MVNESKLDRKTQRRYEDLFDLFQHPGWAHIMDVVNNDMSLVDEGVWSCLPENLGRLQSHKSVLMYFKNLPESTKAEYEALLNQDKEDDEDLDDFDSLTPDADEVYEEV